MQRTGLPNFPMNPGYGTAMAWMDGCVTASQSLELRRTKVSSWLPVE